jgi:hypothetical protein
LENQNSNICIGFVNQYSNTEYWFWSRNQYFLYWILVLESLIPPSPRGSFGPPTVVECGPRRRGGVPAGPAGGAVVTSSSPYIKHACPGFYFATLSPAPRVQELGSCLRAHSLRNGLHIPGKIADLPNFEPILNQGPKTLFFHTKLVLEPLPKFCRQCRPYFSMYR